MNGIKRFFALALAFAVALISLGFRTESARAGGGGVGMDVSGLTSVGLDGEPVDGTVFQNATVTVLNLWQRWCGPCMIELPHFLALHDFYSKTDENDVQVWGALYYEHSYEIRDAIDFIQENGYFWNHMLICDELLAVANVGSPEGLTSIPQTLIVDRHGVVRAQIVGKVDSEAELFALAGEWLEILSAEEALIGDVDGNGGVSAADAILALRHAMGLSFLDEAQLVRADTDGNGSVGVSDAVSILRMAMGLA